VSTTASEEKKSLSSLLQEVKATVRLPVSAIVHITTKTVKQLRRGAVNIGKTTGRKWLKRIGIIKDAEEKLTPSLC